MINKGEWSKEDIDFVLKNYQNMDKMEIAKKLNRTPNSVQIKANRLGLKKYPYYCDKDFFNVIDTQEKAYWLGFIMADGYVSYGKNNSGELGIELKLSDIYHLKKFNKSINGNYIINTRDRKSPFKEGKIIKTCTIRIYSIQLVNDLSNLGVIPNKTYNMQIPNLPEDLFSHFIRGYFDGDGSIYVHNKKQKTIACKFTSASKPFLEELRKYLNNKEIKSFLILNNSKYSKFDCYDLVIGGLQNVNTFLNYIYKDADVYLDRKLKKSINLYNTLDIEQRLPRHSEMGDFYNNWERKLES